MKMFSLRTIFVFLLAFIACSLAEDRNCTDPKVEPLIDEDGKKEILCPSVVHVAWWNIAPYAFKEVTDSETVLKGIFTKISHDIIKECCGSCTDFEYIHEDHDPQVLRSRVDTFEPSNGTNIGTLLYPIDSSVTTLLYHHKPFYPVVESPGVTFLLPTESNGNVAGAVVEAVLQGWPVLVLTIVMAALSGIIMWVMDSYWNPEEFPSSFFKGSWEGFWWAFVTMTTVGYGDRAPRSFIARVFTFFWVLVGLVIISIFTATVTTSLTALSLSNDISLYGKHIAVLNHSEEQKYGVRNNAEVHAANSIDDLKKMIVGDLKPPSMKDKPMIGGLIDSFVAGHRRDDLTESKGFKVGTVFDHPFVYGFVAGGALDKPEVTECMRQGLYTREDEITNIIKSEMGVLPEPEKTAAEEKSSNLFDPSSTVFQQAIFACLGSIALLTICGIVWEYCYWKPKQKKEVDEDDDVERVITPHTSFEELVSAQCQELEDTMILEVLEFYQTYNGKLEEIRRRHLQDEKYEKCQSAHEKSEIFTINEKPPLK